MRVYKIMPVHCNPCCEKDLEDVKVWLKEAPVGESIMIRVLEMTEEEYKNLPEYMGP